MTEAIRFRVDGGIRSPGQLEATARRVLAYAPRLGWVAAIAPILAYVGTLAPTVYNLDSAELSTAASTLGIPHPPGYPLYVLLGKAFTLIPVGDAGYRLNLMSAVFAGLTLLAVYFVVLHLTDSRVAGIAASWMLGFSYHFWADAVVAEVYMLDAFLLASFIWALLRWSVSGRTSMLVLAFFVFGLGLANRTTFLLCLPAAACYVAVNGRSRHSLWWLAPLAVLPGLALYGLLPLRTATDAPYVWGSMYDLTGRAVHMDLTSPSLFWWFVSAGAFQPFAHFHGAGEFASQFELVAGWTWRGFLGIGVVLALLGIPCLWRRGPRDALLLTLIFIPLTAFYTNYAVPDKDTMFLPTFLIVAIAAGAGGRVLLARLGPASSLPAVRVTFALCLLTAPLLVATANYRLVDVSDDYRSREQSEALFDLAEPGSIVVGWWTDIAPLEYLQRVEGRRQDVSLVHSWAVNGQFLIDLAGANLPGRAMYVMHDEPALRERFELVPVDRWYQVELRGGGSVTTGGLP